jgi:mono/diheme cytochrome c family protein
MLMNILIIGFLVVLIIFFGWLARKAWRLKLPILKWPAAILSGLVSLTGIVLTGVVLLGFYRLNVAPYQYPAQNIKVEMTPQQLARGEKLANICLDCHTSTGQFPLDGSKDNLLAGDLPLGELYATNLTRGGPLKDWTDAEIIRAMREGVNRQGQPLLIMPSMAFHNTSDDDALAIVAFLRSQPEVKRDLPPRNLSVAAALLVGAGMVPISAQPPILGKVTTPAPDSLDYGAYIVLSYGCADCHGNDLTGIPSSGLGPSGPNLHQIVPNWNENQFVTFFREGRDPSGRIIGDVMPWRNSGKALSDDDLKILFKYIISLTTNGKTKY